MTHPSNGNLCQETGRPKSKRPLAILCGCIVVALAGYIATAGLSWSLFFHPDEQKIAKWIDQVRDEGYITDRVYPSGWFELFRIQFWLEGRHGKIQRSWQEHFVQSGRINAIDPKSFSLVKSFSEETIEHSVQDGRNFNAWLYVFSALFLFAACLEVGQRPMVALVSSLFFLASAAPIEFTHYCETDGGLVFSLVFFAWIAARAIRKRSWLLVLAAGAAAGFATACKFTLFPLVLWCFIAPFAIWCKPAKHIWRKAAFPSILVLAALGAAAAGYVLGTPALRLAPDWYIGTLGRTAAGTYSEINQNLGGVHSAWAANVHRLVYLGHELLDIGILPIAWALFAWCFWFSRPFRRQAFGLPVIMLLFFPFFVFCCPFVRRQETLPLSIFAMGAGLPLEWILRGEMKWKPSLTIRCIVIAAACLFGGAALITGVFHAGGMISCFMLRDTRAEAQNWLRDSLPTGEPVAFDHYVGQTARNVDCNPIYLEGLPFLWKGRSSLSNTNGVCPKYYVENVGFAGRLPIRDLRTGRLKPQVLKSLENFRASTLPLRSWQVSRETIRPTFGQPSVCLLALEKPAANSLDIPIGYCRPIRLLKKGAHLYDAGGINGLGPVRAVHTVGRRIPIHVNLDHRPRWLVTRMMAGNAPARIVRDALFVPRDSKVGPRGAVAAVLRPNPWESFISHCAAYATMKCRMRGDDQAVLCGSFLANTAAEAARELRAGGNPDEALAILRKAEPLDAEACVEAFLASAEASVKPKDEWTEAARKALAACDSLVSSNTAAEHRPVTLCGTPSEILADFARLRLGSQLIAPGLTLPVYLPPGRYELRFALSPQFSPENVMPRLFAAQTADFTFGQNDADLQLFRTSLDIKRGQMLQVMGRIGDSFAVMSGNPACIPVTAEVEISWSPLSQTLAVADMLRTALDKNNVY